MPAISASAELVKTDVEADRKAVARDRDALKAYLAGLSRVSEAQFKGWSKDQQLAFLINAYNAFTVEKILTRYPDIGSIWDFGKLFGNPFRDRFFVLMGSAKSLDQLEHGMETRHAIGEAMGILMELHRLTRAVTSSFRRLRDHLDVGARREDGAHARADHRLVVREQHPDHRAHAASRPMLRSAPALGITVLSTSLPSSKQSLKCVREVKSSPLER